MPEIRRKLWTLQLLNYMQDNPGRMQIVSWFEDLQDRICDDLELMDGKGTFVEDRWVRDEGGGGRSRVIQGQHIEKGGVMFSHVYGPMPKQIAQGLKIAENDFAATGVSIVLHPKNPWVPIIHMNVRYFETNTGHWWFGGGIDATPHYIIPEQAGKFHQILKEACDGFDPNAYTEYKKWADDYFFNAHRDETRGIGGIFFDRLSESSGYDKTGCWRFVQDVGNIFVDSYKILFEPNIQQSYSEVQSQWQAIRRGRYVEFNLVYDRGTKFGLQTNGRIESILMSMPPKANWLYNYQPAKDSPEAQTQSLLKKDIDWISYTEV